MALPLLLVASSVAAQGMPGGGGGAPPGGGPGGPGGGPGGGSMRAPKPVTVDKRDLGKVVDTMFRQADGNRDGYVTLAELNQIVEQRRTEAIMVRFHDIDVDGDGTLNANEFMAWQNRLGSAADSNRMSLAYELQPAGDAIAMEVGDDPEDRMLAMIVRPLNAITLVEANVNYDQGVTLDEFEAFQNKAFDETDSNGDGTIDEFEIRELMDEQNVGGDRPGPMPGGPRGEPPAAPDRR